MSKILPVIQLFVSLLEIAEESIGIQDFYVKVRAVGNEFVYIAVHRAWRQSYVAAQEILRRSCRIDGSNLFRHTCVAAAP